MRQVQGRGSGMKYMLAGGSVVAAIAMVADVGSLLPKTISAQEVCQEVVEPKVILPRETLSQLLTIPEGAKREQVQQVMKPPYCRLPDMEVRAGAVARREAYPLAFDPKTWLVVLYEGDTYAGYSFSFRR